jgi:hypothetical protein
MVPMIGSLGCPYTCSFCVDSTVRYQPLPYDVIRDDLRFLLTQVDEPMVSWYDPNFGVRFQEYMDLLENAVAPGSVKFLAESTLSLLKESNLGRLRKNGFLAILPGIESWFECGDKAGQGARTDVDKMIAVSEHVNLILQYVPYVQANFVFGLDTDEGQRPFELTKRFLDRVPGVFPGYSFFTAFGGSAPLFKQLRARGRVIPTPYPLLDGHSGPNVVLKNYTPNDFYDQVIDLMRFSFSPKRILKRFRANKTASVRWVNSLRGIGADGWGHLRHHREVRREMDVDRDLTSFLRGECGRVPAIFLRKIRRDLRMLPDALPDDLESMLKTGTWPEQS